MSKVVITNRFNMDSIHEFSQSSGAHYFGDGFIVWGISKDLVY